MNLPDKVWISAEDCQQCHNVGFAVGSIYNNEPSSEDICYLRSTPEREKAAEMKRVLRYVLDEARAAQASDDFALMKYSHMTIENRITALLQQLTPTTTDHDKGN